MSWRTNDGHGQSGRQVAVMFFFNPLQLGFRRVKTCIVGFHIQLLHLSFPAFEEFQASMLAVSTTL
jgi:hypothetical protein